MHRSGENRKEPWTTPSSNSLPLQGRSENRLKRGESFLIPREDRAALVFFINRNYEKNLAELLPGHPLRGNRPTLRKTSERGREGEIRKAFEAQGSNLENRYTASPPLPSPPLFVPIKTESSRTQISLEPFPATATTSNEY